MVRGRGLAGSQQCQGTTCVSLGSQASAFPGIAALGGPLSTARSPVASGVSTQAYSWHLEHSLTLVSQRQGHCFSFEIKCVFRVRLEFGVNCRIQGLALLIQAVDLLAIRAAPLLARPKWVPPNFSEHPGPWPWIL